MYLIEQDAHSFLVEDDNGYLPKWLAPFLDTDGDDVYSWTENPSRYKALPIVKTIQDLHKLIEA